MAGFATRIEARAGKQLSPDQIFEVARTRERKLSLLLMIYIATGLLFMLLPGTFLGVWNLISISDHHAAASISDSWIQAHGHAQVFGWIGTFILGIGFYSIPKLRRMDPFALWIAWTCWGLWTAGVSLRWVSSVYLWHWRTVLPSSALLELAAFLLFFRAVSGHRPEQSHHGLHVVDPKPKFEKWILVVIVGTLALLATLAANAGASVYVALYEKSPAFPHQFDQRFLVLMAWGFMVSFIWGFSAKWLPVFLGLRPPLEPLLLAASATNVLGVIAALVGKFRPATILLIAASLLSIVALRLFEPLRQKAKVKGVHASFPVFVRLAYVWLVIAAILGLWAAFAFSSDGIWGASRHALTVGLVATMVFCVGQRVLPAFSGMRMLFSTRLMFMGLLLLTVGCILRVAMEVLAYQRFASWAWSWLPLSAVLELSAVTLFAFNMIATFMQRPAPDLNLSDS
jgi:hypothetical protein